MADQVRTAYADESFDEQDGGGYYVLAAACFELSAYDHARETAALLRGGHRISKLHWTKMNPEHREHAAKAVAAVEGFHIVTIGAPVPKRRQERARARCLDRLVVELHGYGIEALVIEAREPELNRRDVKTVEGVRHRLSPVGASFRVDHVPGPAEPLLWIADVVAGAVRAEQEGDPQYREIFGDRIYDVLVPTGC